ncbi:MAG TPA: hypothetical protein P5274_03005 [Candidatus Paceibacterota bacterium]|nr:hypothetical protein [Candidatus Paceibacterota bacterium]
MPEITVVVEEPILVILISLSDGVTEGRYEAVEDLVEGFVSLKKEHPDRQFQLLPESYRTVGGENPALVSLMAVSF